MPEVISMVVLGVGVFLLSCSVAVIGYGIVRFLSDEKQSLKVKS